MAIDLENIHRYPKEIREKIGEVFEQTKPKTDGREFKIMVFGTGGECEEAARTFDEAFKKEVQNWKSLSQNWEDKPEEDS